MQGIEPCKDNILIYTDPQSGEKYGYFDGWAQEEDDPNPYFEYTGAGRGKQGFDGPIGSRNRAIRDHVKDGRALRVFKADGKVAGSGTKNQRYIGEFELDTEKPFVPRLARNDEGETREVIVFRLRPVDALEPTPKDSIKPLQKTEVLSAPASEIRSTLIETENNKNNIATRKAIPGTSVHRREAILSDDFKEFLESHNHEVRRYQIRTGGLASSLQTDLYDTDAQVLYEAKGTCSREAIRMAIGQLMDYQRHINPPNPTLAVLLPNRPQDDLVDLLNSVNINIVYRHEGHFVGWPIDSGPSQGSEGSTS